MNVRLVAYRKATSGASSTTAYNLDLQEAPNISLNYQFSDIKEPETRKGSFSQTFKLPFTDNNNQFFHRCFLRRKCYKEKRMAIWSTACSNSQFFLSCFYVYKSICKIAHAFRTYLVATWHYGL